MLKKLRKNQKGFTLIEVLIVVAILIILAAVAVPNIIGLQRQAAYGVIVANASEIATAANIYTATSSSSLTAPTDLASAVTFKKALGDLAPILESYEADAYECVVYDSSLKIFKPRSLEDQGSVEGIKKTIPTPEKDTKVTISS